MTRITPPETAFRSCPATPASLSLRRCVPSRTRTEP